MTIKLNNFNYDLQVLMRRLGYRPLGYTDRKELNSVRPLGGTYPRFHVYASATPEVVTMNIHLDQKKVSYEGVTAHSGDYDSETVREEVLRIKEMISRISD